MSFGEKLRQLRKERNWSQDALGAALTDQCLHQEVSARGDDGQRRA